MKKPTPEECFAALKLIELLYKDGHISQLVFKNILNEHSDVIDITQYCLQIKD